MLGIECFLFYVLQDSSFSKSEGSHQQNREDRFHIGHLKWQTNNAKDAFKDSCQYSSSIATTLKGSKNSYRHTSYQFNNI